MISKLLLVRKKDIDSTLAERMGVSGFVKGKPIPVTPQTWVDEHGITHWAFVLEGMKVKDYNKLIDFIESNATEGITLHEYDADKGIDKMLEGVGLRINKSM